jgi:hypothetical protein
MSATVFLMINGLIVFYLLIRLFFIKAPKPTALKTESTQSQAPVVARNHTKAALFSERSLNCYFQFNGHMFDAFEVLGLPAGSGKEACDRALVDFRRNADSDHHFLSACTGALQKHFSNL